jgi:hypothetical protein
MLKRYKAMVTNLCKKGTMSICTGTDLQDQKKCKFYEPSRYREQCMYKVFGEFCSCLDAQIDSAKPINQRNQDTIDKS